jgi:hypothetical protein
MRSLLRVLALLSLTVLLSAQVAAAKPPTREPFIQDPIAFAAGELCTFAVSFENVRGGQTLTTFSNGVVRITGAVWTRVTNLDTGRSVTLISSGPGTITTNPDGSVTLKIVGPALLFFFPGELGPGRAGAILSTTGLVTEVLTPDFSHVISFSHLNGTTEDLCRTLLP